MGSLPTGTVTFLVIDLEGSTAIEARLGRERLDQLRPRVAAMSEDEAAAFAHATIEPALTAAADAADLYR
jgi:class 3 adenylate cyclase